jgi:transposase
MVIDWAEAAPGLFVFCAVLAYSRWRFVRFATDQKASTTLAMITEALAAIGGVPAKVLADRMGCLKGWDDWCSLRINRSKSERHSR